eukprot:jgi/Antlo1/1543/1302
MYLMRSEMFQQTSITVNITFWRLCMYAITHTTYSLDITCISVGEYVDLEAPTKMLNISTIKKV